MEGKLINEKGAEIGVFINLPDNFIPEKNKVYVFYTKGFQTTFGANLEKGTHKVVWKNEIQIDKGVYIFRMIKE